MGSLETGEDFSNVFDVVLFRFKGEVTLDEELRGCAKGDEARPEEMVCARGRCPGD